MHAVCHSGRDVFHCMVWLSYVLITSNYLIHWQLCSNTDKWFNKREMDDNNSDLIFAVCTSTCPNYMTVKTYISCNVFKHNCTYLIYLDINVCMYVYNISRCNYVDTRPILPYIVATVVVVAHCWSSATVLLDVAFRPSGKCCPVLD
jgi:hypothetical protein